MQFTFCRTTEVDGESRAPIEEKAREFASIEGYRVTAGADGALLLSRGSWWSLHRDDISHSIRIGAGTAGRTQVSVSAFSPFFERARLARFVERRLEAFGKAAGINTGPGPNETGRIPQKAPPVRPGVFLSMMLAALFASAASIPFAFALAEGARRELLSACAIAVPPHVFLPGAAALNGMTFADILCSSVFVAIGAGFAAALAAMPFLVAAEVGRQWSRALPLSLAGAGVVLAGVAAFGSPAPWSVLLAAAPPAAGLGWALAARRRLGDVQPHALLCHVGAAFAFAGLSLVVLLAATGGRDVFTGARDRFLLVSGPGRAASDFYYSRSLLAARAVQSPRDPNRQKVFLACLPPDRRGKSLARVSERMFGVLVNPGTGPEAIAAASSGSIDAILVSDDWFAAPGAPDRAAFEAAARAPLIWCFFPGDPGANSSLEHVATANLSSETSIAIALESALDRGAGRGPLGFLCFFGTALAGVCWPAFAWALFASSAAFLAFYARSRLRRSARPRTGNLLMAGLLALGAASLAAPPALVLPGRGAMTARDLSSGEHAPAEAVDGLVRLLSSPGAETRYEAALGLSRLLTGIRVEASRAGSGGVEAFIEARGAVASDQAFGVLSAAMSDRDPRVRMWAASAAGPLDDERAVEHLTRLLKTDPFLNVRCKAAFALGQVGDARSLWELTVIARDEKEPWYLRLYALRAVQGR